METRKTGLIERVQARITLGLPVEAQDVLDLCNIVNHNGAKMCELSKRVDQLEKPKQFVVKEFTPTTAMQDFAANRDLKLH